MSLIELTVGKENNRVTTAEVYAFFCDTEEELSVYQATLKYPLKISRVGPTASFPAIIGSPKEVGGAWSRANYSVAEGGILKLWVRRKTYEGTYAKVVPLWIQAREQGPFNNIRIQLLGTNRSATPEATVSGRFDVIDYAKTFAAGRKSRPDFAPAADIAEVFNIELVSPEIAPKDPPKKVTVVTLPSGQVAAYQEPKNERFLNI